MKVVAHHVPLSATSSFDVLSMLQEQVRWCEARGVEILCCPEAVLCSLADYANASRDVAIGVAGGQLQRLLAPLTSDTVATLWGGRSWGEVGNSTTPLLSFIAVWSLARIASYIRPSIGLYGRRAIAGVYDWRVDLWHSHLQRLELLRTRAHHSCQRSGGVIHSDEQWLAADQSRAGVGR